MATDPARDETRRLERWRTDWLPSEQAYAAAQDPMARVDAVITDTADLSELS